MKHENKLNEFIEKNNDDEIDDENPHDINVKKSEFFSDNQGEYDHCRIIELVKGEVRISIRTYVNNEDLDYISERITRLYDYISSKIEKNKKSENDNDRSIT